MEPDEVITHIEQESGKGIDPEIIYQHLLQSGWDRGILLPAFIKKFGYNSIQAIKLPGIEAIFQNVILRYRSHLSAFLIAGALMQSFTLLQYFFRSAFMMSLISPIGSMVIGTVVSLIGLVVGLWIQAALMYYIIFSESGVTLKEALEDTRAKFISYWLLMILEGLIILAGLLLLVVPGIVFSIWFSLTSFVFFAERIGGQKALSKSKMYVKGYEYPLFGRLFVFGITLWAMQLLAGYVMKAVGSPAFSTVATAIISVLVMPVMPLMLHMLYLHLKEVKSVKH